MWNGGSTTETGVGGDDKGTKFKLWKLSLHR